MLVRWVVKTYINCEGGFLGIFSFLFSGVLDRRFGGGLCGGFGVLFLLRGSWAVWLGFSCGVVMVGFVIL